VGAEEELQSEVHLEILRVDLGLSEQLIIKSKYWILSTPRADAHFWLEPEEMSSLSTEQVEVRLRLGHRVSNDLLPSFEPLPSEKPDWVGPVAGPDSEHTGIFFAPLGFLKFPARSYRGWDLRHALTATCNGERNAVNFAMKSGAEWRFFSENTAIPAVLAGEELLVLCPLPPEPEFNSLQNVSLSGHLTPFGEAPPQPAGTEVYGRELKAHPINERDLSVPLHLDMRLTRLRLDWNGKRIASRYYLSVPEKVQFDFVKKPNNVPALRTDPQQKKGELSIDLKTSFATWGAPKELKLALFVDGEEVGTPSELGLTHKQELDEQHRLAITDDKGLEIGVLDLRVNPNFERRLAVDWGAMHHFAALDQTLKGSVWEEPRAIQTNLRKQTFFNGEEQGLCDQEVTADFVSFGTHQNGFLFDDILPRTRSSYLDGERENLWRKGTQYSGIIPYNVDLDEGQVGDYAHEIEDDLKFRFWHNHGKSSELQWSMLDAMRHFFLACDMQEVHQSRLSEMIRPSGDVTEIEPLQIVATHPLSHSAAAVRSFGELLRRSARPLHARLKKSLAEGGVNYRHDEENGVDFGILTIPEPIAAIAADVRRSKGRHGKGMHRYVCFDFGRRTFDTCIADIDFGKGKIGSFFSASTLSDPIPLDQNYSFALHLLHASGCPLGGQTIDAFLMAALCEHENRRGQGFDAKEAERMAFGFPMLTDANEWNGDEKVASEIVRRRKSTHALRLSRLVEHAKRESGVTGTIAINADQVTHKLNLSNYFSGKIRADVRSLISTHCFQRLERVLDSLVRNALRQALSYEGDYKELRVLVTGRAPAFGPVGKIFRDVSERMRPEDSLEIRVHSDYRSAKSDVAEGAAILARSPSGLLSSAEPLAFVVFIGADIDGAVARALPFGKDGAHEGRIRVPQGAERMTVLSGQLGFDQIINESFVSDPSPFDRRLNEMLFEALIGPRDSGRLYWRGCDGLKSMTYRVESPEPYLNALPIEFPDLSFRFELALEGAFMT
jgi:hypothetical protein